MKSLATYLAQNVIYPNNARFWVMSSNDGWVKITLKPGQSIQHNKSSTHEEGNSFEGNKWTHDGDGVVCEWGSDCTDCDGRHRSNGKLFCLLADLQKHAAATSHPLDLHDGQKIHQPDWQQHTPTRCRDQFAELANY